MASRSGSAAWLPHPEAEEGMNLVDAVVGSGVFIAEFTIFNVEKEAAKFGLTAVIVGLSIAAFSTAFYRVERAIRLRSISHSDAACLVAANLTVLVAVIEYFRNIVPVAALSRHASFFRVAALLLAAAAFAATLAAIVLRPRPRPRTIREE